MDEAALACDAMRVDHATVGEAIMPPQASRPEQVCALVCDGLSDGDLEAAVAQYEPSAALAHERGRTARGHAQIRAVLANAAASRLLFSVRVEQVLIAGDLALVSGQWSGGDPDAGEGRYWSVVRNSSGRWRIAVEHIDAAGARNDWSREMTGAGNE